MVAAIFFPHDPNAEFFDLAEQAASALQRGLRLYTNGRQMALLPKPLPGWALVSVKTSPEMPPCAA